MAGSLNVTYKNPGGSPLSGCAAIVTGAGRGIGRAIAVGLASNGAQVVCISRTGSNLESLAELINSKYSDVGARGFAVPYDLLDIDGIRSVIEKAHHLLGKPADILVNSAGMTRIDALGLQVDMGIWQKVLTTNLTAPVALTCGLLPTMLSEGRGTIISIGSRCGAFDIPYSSAYSASKTALLRFHQNIQLELGGKGVNSYYIQPGNVDTGIMDVAEVVDSNSSLQVEGVQRLVAALPKRPKTPPGRVADACVMLASHPDAALLSGMYIDLDGNVDELLEDMRKGQESACRRRQLHVLKMEML